MKMLLKGERVVLRPVEKAHIPQLADWFSQYELLRMIVPGTVAPVNLEGEEAWFESINQDRSSYTFSLFASDDPQGFHLLGTCSLMNHHGKNRSASLGIAIGEPSRRGCGYGAEALQLLLEFGFLEMNLNRIELQVLEFNAGARRLYERLGFTTDGTLREALFREGRYWNILIMSILRAEYRPAPHWNLA